MTDQATVKATAPEPKKAPKKRSKPARLAPGTNPPYISVSEAFELAQKVHDQGGGQASVDLMSELTGNSSSSSSYTKKINALKTYGLVTWQGGMVALAELGLAITAPQSVEGAAQAKKESFLKVDVFNKLYDRHKGKLLPEDQFLLNIITQDLKVNRDFAPAWMEAFKDGLRAAGLSFTRNDGKTQIRELGVGMPEPKKQEIPPPQPPPPGGVAPLANAMPIPLGIGVTAQIQLPPDFKVADLPRLLKMLALALGEGKVELTVKLTDQNTAPAEDS